MLSVSQLCKIGYNCLFIDVGVTVFRRSDDSIAFKGVLNGQLYLVNFNDNNVELDTCLIAETNMVWLWHCRLAHVGMKNLHKLLKGEHNLGLTNVYFKKDKICSACQVGKQVGAWRRFETGGSPSRRVSVPRAPAQMGRARGRARRGEKRGGRRRA